jgi:3-hydroxyacyl-CoA dehydrogenase
VAVIGAGTMGGGIAMNSSTPGIPVTILETKQEALDKGSPPSARTTRHGEEGPPHRRQDGAAPGLLKPTLSYDDLKDADLVIEAVFEEIGVKEQVFRSSDEVGKPGAIPRDPTVPRSRRPHPNATKRPQDVVGMHFFSPANVMKLLEVVRGKATR